MSARSLALSATLAVTLLAGCHKNASTAAGATTVRMPDGSTQVIAPGQPLPVGSTVIAVGNGSAPVSPSTDAPVTDPAAANMPQLQLPPPQLLHRHRPRWHRPLLRSQRLSPRWSFPQEHA